MSVTEETQKKMQIEMQKIDYDSPILIGHGFDVHVFSNNPDRSLILGGVVLDGYRGLEAHSDGDVVLHSITDAILGALGLGDIGKWFPDSDHSFKGADSKGLLEVVLDATKGKFKVSNLDVTIVCEKPKLNPHFPQIKDCIKKTIDCQLVNLKATTYEGVNAEGRGECISVHSVCLLKNLNFH